jgi:membrane fusion protein (multidrug efflux system)
MHTTQLRFGLLGAFLGAALLNAGCSGSRPAQAPRIAVTAMRIAPHPVAVAEEYPAQLEASNTVEIRPRVSGILERYEAVEGQRVRAGQILFVIDRQPFEAALAQAQAALAQAQAAEAQAERDLERARPLSQLDALSQRELDAAIAADAATKAQVRAAQAVVRTAALNLEYTIVRAPIDGVMSRALIRIGGLVTAYSTLMTTIYQNDPMFVNFSISEQRLLDLQHELGRPPDQRNPSRRQFRVFLTDGSEINAPADLNFVDAAVDLRTDTLPVRLAIHNPKQLLRAGQYVRVSVDTPAQADAIVIPQRAVQELQDKRFVWTVDKDGKAAARDVTMGARIGPDWLVLKGLAAGDRVVVDGTQKLKQGVPVDTEPKPGGEPRAQ